MQKTNNHIDEYFLKNDNNTTAIASKELFKGENIELRTDLKDEEIVLINSMMFNNKILKEIGCEEVFNPFINNFMRLKVSKDRKSRGEFVSINKQNDANDVISSMGNIGNVMNSRK